MQLTKDFLKGKRASEEWLAWFLEHFGETADYQEVLDRLAQESKCSWADWLLKAVGPIEAVPMVTTMVRDRASDPNHAALPLIEAASRAKPTDYEECLSCQ